MRTFSVKDIKEIYQLRIALEVFFIEVLIGLISDNEIKEMRKLSEKYLFFAKKGDLRSCLECDIQFHEFLMKASGNSRLVEIVNNFSLQVKSIAMGYLEIHERGEKTAKEHLAIIDALSKGDAELAKKLTREHIMDAEKHALAIVQGG